MSFKGKILIIGASSAGISAAQTIRKSAPEAEITILSAEFDYPYFRPYLTEFIGNTEVEKKSNFYLFKPEWYHENKINLMLGEKAIEINNFSKTVKTESGKEYDYDKLIIACGSKPFIPIKDALLNKNIFALKTLEHAKKIAAYAEKSKKAVIIGGGLLGLEAAYALKEKGIKIVVLEFSSRILPAQLDLEGSIILEKLIKSQGVDFIPSAEAESFVTENYEAKAVKLKSGEEITADFFLFSVGVRAELDLASSCRIKTQRGIIVNSKMETSEPDIFACGDAAEFGKVPALWIPAQKMGKIAALNAIGEPAEFTEESYPAVLNSFGTKLYSTGDILKLHPIDSYISMSNYSSNNSLKKLFFFEKKLVGGYLLGDISKGAILSKLINSGADYSETDSKIFE